jgi:hypothetical protein
MEAAGGMTEVRRQPGGSESGLTDASLDKWLAQSFTESASGKSGRSRAGMPTAGDPPRVRRRRSSPPLAAPFACHEPTEDGCGAGRAGSTRGEPELGRSPQARRPASPERWMSALRSLTTWQWRLSTGGTGLVFLNTRGGPISESGWSNWRRRIWYGPDTNPGPGRVLGKPYLLRHTCASLLVREGRSVTEVAEQMGHSAEECLRTYAHVFRDYDSSDRADREALIRHARAEVFGSEASGEAVGG